MDDRWASRAFWAGWAAAGVILLALAREQWFVRDDWAVVLTRQADKADGGAHWLLYAQDGHWMTVPVALWDLTMRLFDLRSYWPYLLPVIAAHLASVVLVRVICRRAGVTPWTTTIMCVLLAMFGTGFENLVFAVQITYTLSLLAFLAQLVLVDHEGRPDWRDALGAVVALIGAMSSGFGPFFVVGVALVLVLRRRWTALLGVAPAALALAWWYLTYGSDGAAAANPGSKALVPEFAYEGLLATLRGLVGADALAGIAAAACGGTVVWLGRRIGANAVVLGMTATTIIMFLGIGWERVGLGMDLARQSRYAGMAAMLLAPIVALTLDQLGRLGSPALAAGRLVLLGSLVLNAGRLWNDGVHWSTLSAADRRTFELVAGSPRLAEADPARNTMTTENPDVRVTDIPRLVALGAITPRPPVTPADQAVVDAALGLPPEPAS